MSLDGMQLSHYRIAYEIAKGGMSVVYRAEDTRNGQQVAIKIGDAEETEIYPGIDAGRDVARTFKREMDAIAKLKHPHILPLLDYDEEFVNGARRPYLVMPLCPEGSLRQWLPRWLKQRGSLRLSLQEVASLIHQAADALQYAHDNGVIHRDVKPHNFLISSTRKYPNLPDLLLADFGIAKFMTASASLTHSHRGTFAYMAPERWESSPVQDNKPVPATDQYSLAVMAFELLTGRLPFLGNTMQLIAQHLKEQPPPPSKLDSRLSIYTDEVLLKALAKKPEERFKHVRAFARALEYTLGPGETTLLRLPKLLPPPDDVTTVRAPKPPIYGNSPIQGVPELDTLPAPHGRDIHKTLLISKAEARAGTTRRIVLPEKRTVEMQVPADVTDGWVIRVEGEGEAIPNGARGALIVTIEVKDK